MNQTNRKIKNSLYCIGFSLVSLSCGTSINDTTGESNLSTFGSIEQGDYEECRQILEQDLFNSFKNGSDYLAKDLLEMEFYSLSENEAWSRYQDWQKKSSSGGGSGELDVFSYFNLELGGSSGSSLDQGQFNERFNRAKQVYKTKLKTDNFQSTTSNYSSHLRDAGSVAAWKECVTRPRTEARMLCYGYRDASNRAFIHVIYNAGITAGTNPQLKVDFPSGDVQLQGGTNTVGNGAGKYYMLNSRGDQGITVPVNGELPGGNTTFSCQATIPPAKSTIDVCEIQRVRGLISGWITESTYSVYKSANWVPFKNQNSGNIGATSCTTYQKYY